MIQGEIRRALPDEATKLSALALRSKALWGYDAAFMEACRVPLTVDPEAIAKCPFYVLDEGGRITGFFGLSGQPPRGEIEFLFVEPDSVRSGRGRRLARHFLALARSLGFEEMDVSADPYAEDFYVAMGAVRIAKVPSDAIPNRLIHSPWRRIVLRHHLNYFAPLVAARLADEVARTRGARRATRLASIRRAVVELQAAPAGKPN